MVLDISFIFHTEVNVLYNVWCSKKHTHTQWMYNWILQLIAIINKHKQPFLCFTTWGSQKTNQTNMSNCFIAYRRVGWQLFLKLSWWSVVPVCSTVWFIPQFSFSGGGLGLSKLYTCPERSTLHLHMTDWQLTMSLYRHNFNFTKVELSHKGKWQVL